MNLRFEKLENILGLHEEIQIIYVVDGYEATLYKDDGDTEVIRVHSETIDGALQLLNDTL